MTDQYYCKLCDKTVNKKRKARHIKTETHKQNERGIIYNYHIEKPALNFVEEIVKNYANEFQNDFESGNVSCRFSLLFNDGLIDYDVEVMRVDLNSIGACHGYLSILKNLQVNNNFGNISHLTITIKTSLKQMTKSFYLKVKKPMTEGLLFEKNIDHYI